MIRALSTLLVCVTLAACPVDLAGPRSDLDGLPDGLDVQLTVDPVEVGQHAPFDVHFSVTNTTDRTIEVITGHGCLVTPHVTRNGARIPFEGSWWGCTAAVTTHTFAPGETRSRTWDMRAELYAENPGESGGAPAPKGDYRVLVVFDTYTEGGAQPQPGIDASLRVR